MLHIATWLWGADKFAVGDVAKLEAGLARNITQPYKFLLVTGDKILDPHLTKVKGCFARLRTFDPLWQYHMGVQDGDRIVTIDLDTVITGPLDPLFDRPEPFVIMQGGNAVNPCPYGGALQMLQARYRPDVWSDFSLDAAAKVPFHSFPDDQAWLHAKIPDAAGWKVGPEHGVYVYGKPGWPKRLPLKPVARSHPRYEEFTRDTTDDLPRGARLVTFINKHPSQLAHLDWVKEHWR